MATVALAVFVAATLVGAPVACAAGKSEAQRGSAILDSVQSGQRTCAQLTSADFVAVGEFAMQRMVGSATAHEAMDQAMTRMMGANGLLSMHRFLGQRFSGCARGPAPRGITGIMGMLGMMNGAGRGYGPGMMGGGPGGVHGPGMMGRRSGQGGAYGPGMMGRAFGARDHDDGWNSASTVGVISLAVILLLLIGATVAYGRRRGRSVKGPATGAIEILDRRFAAGEIDNEEYQRRRAALGGGT